MSKKGENIFKRKDGRWEARYVKGFDAAGKKKYGYCYAKTYREVKDKVEKLKRMQYYLSDTASADSFQKTMAQFCDEWLFLQKNRLKESTYVRYDSMFTNHIKPYLGGLYPLALHDSMIGQFSLHLTNEKRLSPKTVKDILGLLRTVLKYTAHKFPGSFPALQIVYPRDETKEVRVLSREEQEQFLAYLQCDLDPCRFGILLAALTGIRIGELCALQWCDILPDEQTIRITRTVQRIRNMDEHADRKSKIIFDTPKSERSVRTIPLTTHAAELCGRMHPGSPAVFILTGTEQYMEPRTLQYRLKSMMKECGLEGVHFHTLRHTFATRCVEVGFDIKSLSEILGHANTTVTLERYVHSSMQFKHDNMKKLESIGF